MEKKNLHLVYATNTDLFPLSPLKSLPLDAIIRKQEFSQQMSQTMNDKYDMKDVPQTPFASNNSLLSHIQTTACQADHTQPDPTYPA